MFSKSKPVLKVPLTPAHKKKEASDSKTFAEAIVSIPFAFLFLLEYFCKHYNRFDLCYPFKGTSLIDEFFLV